MKMKGGNKFFSASVFLGGDFQNRARNLAREVAEVRAGAEEEAPEGLERLRARAERRRRDEGRQLHRHEQHARLCFFQLFSNFQLIFGKL